jgi:hypothetical protein
VAKIDFCGSRAAGKIKNSNDDSHLNPSFFYYIDNSTKHCAHTMLLLFFIRPPAVLHHQPQSEQFFLIICFTIDGYITGDRYDRLSIPMSLPDYTAPRTHVCPIFPRRFKTIESIDRTAPNLKFLKKKNICAGKTKKKETVKIIT